MKFIVEGYRTDQEKPVYRTEVKSIYEMVGKLTSAFVNKKSHFVTIRRILEVK